MTYSLNLLIAPPNLLAPGEITMKTIVVPASPGIYGWWFTDALPDVPMAGCQTIGAYSLLYVGIAKSRVGGTRTLRDRLKNHMRGPAATSTLRRTLVALLKDKLSLSPRLQENGKMILPIDHEQRLSAWLQENARLSWIEHTAPWELEDELLTRITLPLNIRGNKHPFAKVLSAKRVSVTD